MKKYFLENSYSMLQPTYDFGECFICPPKLYIDITEDCNLYCQMCREKGTECGREMSNQIFRAIIDETAPYVRSYSLFYLGEPLMLSDFKERVDYVYKAKRMDCNIEISTNGMLLNDNICQFLAERKVLLIISIDGANKETFESIRRGADFYTVIENAKTAASVYSDFDSMSAPSFYISIQRDNQNQLTEIAKLAFSCGIRRIGCGIVVSPKEYAPQISNDGDLCRELERMYEYAAKQGIFLDIYPTKVGDYIFTDGKYCDSSDYSVSTACNAPLISAAVRYDGQVFLCCNGGECVGDIFTAGGFLSLWKSESYNRLRRMVNNTEHMPSRCINCPWFNRN